MHTTVAVIHIKLNPKLITHYSLLITHYSLLITHYSLLITHYSLLSFHPILTLIHIHHQGSSADIIKIAMIHMHEVLQNYQARLLLQVHDELVLEVPADEWEELQVKIKSVMENAVKLDVPLVVDVNQGENWMETK